MEGKLGTAGEPGVVEPRQPKFAQHGGEPVVVEPWEPGLAPQGSPYGLNLGLLKKSTKRGVVDRELGNAGEPVVVEPR